MLREIFSPISSSEATTVVVLCIHGCLRLEEPLDHGIVAFAGCQVQRCVASGATARGKPRAEPNGTKGRNFGEKFRAPQKSKFWKLWPSKILPNFRNVVVLRCFDDIELVERTVAFGFLAVKMSWTINQNIYSNSGAKSDPKVFISSYFYKANY